MFGLWVLDPWQKLKHNCLIWVSFSRKQPECLFSANDASFRDVFTTVGCSAEYKKVQRGVGQSPFRRIGVSTPKSK